jgi:hypothetical protein
MMFMPHSPSVRRFRCLVVHPRQHRVEALIALLGLAPVALDPLVHQVEDLRLQPHRPGLRARRPTHDAGTLQHLEVLVDRLQRHLVGLGELVHGRVTRREPGHHVAPGRIGQRREDPRQRVCRHRHPTSFNPSVER